MLIKAISKLYVSVLALTCVFLSTWAQAADSPYGQCSDSSVTESSQQVIPLDPNTPAEFTADQAKRNENGIATLEGAVQMTRGTQTVDAEKLEYDENNKNVVASGNVRAEDQQLIITSQAAELNLETDYAKSEDASYIYKPLHASGKAKSIERSSADLVRFEDTTYSTCEEDDRTWELSADEVELNKSTGDGIGRDVLVKFKGVPIFYTPWIRFPIDDRRKSGFLAPTIGSSNDSGFELETPWYWNISPNKDAIFSPRLLTDRGLQLKSNFRYLNKKSAGQLGLEYLDDSEFKDDRYLASFEHISQFTSNLKLDLLYNKLSDENYFEDLGDGLGLSSTQYVERHGDLSYQTDHWDFLARAQSFQIADESLPNIDKPFKRIPQIKLDSDYYNLPGGFDFGSESEWVQFEHDDKIDGDRLHLGIELERPFESNAYFIRPGARLNYTEYDLNRRDGVDDKPTRSIPSAHLDAGLIFEKNLKKSAHIQTLEPRLYYLHTPFRNQDDIPVFDSAEYEFGFEQLFRDDRFSGSDRIGDADRLSIGLTTRVLDLENGAEKFRASIGRIFHFRDRKVALPGESRDGADSSEVAAELKIGLHDRWEAIASTLYDTHDDHTERNSVRFQYHSENDFIFNMGYRYRRRDIEPIDSLSNRRENLEQSDISMVLPINEHWRAVTRWNYDLQEKRNLEQLVGVEYDTCCWKLRLAGRRYNQNTDEDYNNSIELQLVLKDLGQIGSPIGELLERGIRGYDARDDEYF
ncbi:MAG: LPS assembly protein LptD [Gammaproteobacteria bacterium]|nr:MAG: LPS assembly protein LptD [Gammaproteobacteria bacterium]